MPLVQGKCNHRGVVVARRPVMAAHVAPRGCVRARANEQRHALQEGGPVPRRRRRADQRGAPSLGEGEGGGEGQKQSRCIR